MRTGAPAGAWMPGRRISRWPPPVCWRCAGDIAAGDRLADAIAVGLRCPPGRSVTNQRCGLARPACSSLAPAPSRSGHPSRCSPSWECTKARACHDIANVAGSPGRGIRLQSLLGLTARPPAKQLRPPPRECVRADPGHQRPDRTGTGSSAYYLCAAWRTGSARRMSVRRRAKRRGTPGTSFDGPLDSLPLAVPLP